MKQCITIIGGTDGFGKWLASFLMKKFGDKIILTITGRNRLKGEECAKSIGVIFSTNTIASVKGADVTVFSVPIAYMEQTIEEVAPYLKKGSVVADVCSIKGFPTQALQKYAPKSVLVIPIHPMFGPFINSIAGQIFVLTPEQKVKEERRYKFLVKFLQSSGARILETSAQEHDKMMAIVQGLTHFDIFVFGETLRKLGINLGESLQFVSPVYKLMISSVARYMSQNPSLYSEIQMYNKQNLIVHEKYIEVSQEFQEIVKNKDHTKFLAKVEKTQKYFGENAQKGQIYTDKIIFLLSKQIEGVKSNIGKKLHFENIYSGEIIEETVIQFEDDIIYLENGEELVLDEWRVFE